MSEHELWNELGNLYFLSGTYKQAIHAYNKAIQLESSFGKPFSNLALIYTKQARYEDAIQLYKKSLGLLTDTTELAITWNRLGNVYRQLKNYEDAVAAYQSADDLRSNIVANDEQSNQMLYVSSESESLPYEVVEEQQDYQYHFADYMIGVEPEFDEALPEFAPAKAKVLAKEYQLKQNTLRDGKTESISEPASVLLVDDEKTPVSVYQENMPPTPHANIEVYEPSQTESATKDIDESIERALSENVSASVAAQKPNNNVLSKPEATSKTGDSEVVSCEEVPTILEADNRPEKDALETEPSFSEHIAQSENIVETLPGNLPAVLSDADDCLDNDSPARDDGLSEPAISAEDATEELPDELGAITEESDSHPNIEMPEAKAWFIELTERIEHEPDKSAEVKSDEETSSILDAGNRPEEDSPETDPSFSDQVAQSENIAEALPDYLPSALSDADDYRRNDALARDDRLSEPAISAEEDAVELPDELGVTPDLVESPPSIDTIRKDDLPSALSETNCCLDNETPARDEGSIGPEISAKEDIENLQDEVETITAETDSHLEIELPEVKGGFVESTDPNEHELDKNAEYAPNLAESAHPIDSVPETVKEELQKTEYEVDSEEEKLAKQIEINPLSATTWEALGTLYKSSGRYGEAIQAFEQAVSIAPGTVSYYHNLGLVYSVSGNNEGAFNAFQKVLELDPSHSLAHASLGGYYKKIGLEELAQHHIGKAMKYIYDSENEYNRACLEAICGNTDQAIKFLRTALEKKQTYVDWVLHDPDLDSMRDDEGFKQLISEFSK